jgi:hypothetical protein
MQGSNGPTLSEVTVANRPTVPIVYSEATEPKATNRSWKDFLTLLGDSAAAIGTFALLTVSAPTKAPNLEAGRDLARATWVVARRLGRRPLTLRQARELALAVLHEAEARRAHLVAEEAAREAAMAELGA